MSLVEIASRHHSNTFNQSRTHPLWLLVVNTSRVSWVIVTAAKFLPPDCFSDVELLLRSNSTQATALAAITANATTGRKLRTCDARPCRTVAVDDEHVFAFTVRDGYVPLVSEPYVLS